jgi:hypothetical protein
MEKKLKWICKKCDEDRDWFDMAQYRDSFQAVVNATMDIELRFAQLSALESWLL